MCGAQRSWKFNFSGNGPERSANSINRNWVGKRNLFFHSWWQRGKQFFHTEKIPRSKREEFVFHTIRVATRRLDATAFRREDGRAMKILCLFFALCSAVLAAEPAPTVFVNGNIYTMNEKQPRAEAIAVKGDRIVFVGSNADAKKYEADGARTIDLGGKTVVPGLTDSHCHIFGIGEREMTLNLEGTDTLEAFLAKVKERVAKTEPGKWITGRGWIETFWRPPQFPTRQDLDKIAPDNPVVLTRADGHAVIANSAALRIAKVDKETANPFGGEVLKEKQTG